MTALEYAKLVLETRDLIFDKISEVLPAECDKEKRFIQTGIQTEDQWMAALQNEQSSKIRMFVLLMKNLSSSELAKTAGAKNFKTEVRFSVELFHDYAFGVDDNNSEHQFILEALMIQFAIETNRSLTNQAVIDKYNFSLGIRPSNTRSLHLGRGELTVSFKEIRY
jgi:hypothetical protein